MKISEDKLKQIILEELMLEAETRQYIMPQQGDRYIYVDINGELLGNFGSIGEVIVNKVQGNKVEFSGRFENDQPGEQVVDLETHSGNEFMENLRYLGPKEDRAKFEKELFKIRLAMKNKEYSEELLDTIDTLQGTTYGVQQPYNSELELYATKVTTKLQPSSNASASAAASDERSPEDQYKELAKELFPNVAVRDGGIDYLKGAFPEIKDLEREKKRLERARIQIGSIDKENGFDFNNDGDENEEDVELYNNIVNTRRTNVRNNPDSEIVTFDQLLTAAAASSSEESSDDRISPDSERSATTDTLPEVQVEFVKFKKLREELEKFHYIVVKITGLNTETEQRLNNYGSDGSGAITWDEFDDTLEFQIAGVDFSKNAIQDAIKDLVGDNIYQKILNTTVESEGKKVEEIVNEAESDGYLPASEREPEERTADSDEEEAAAAADADGPGSQEDEVDPNLFVPTPEVEAAVEAMKGFYDKPYLYEQGELLRTLIKAIEAAYEAPEERTGISSDTETLQEAKGLNIKNIKASLNAFLQQTRKVKKALQEYIAMAEKAKAGSKRKKAILDKEVDKLIEYGKMILKSLPKTISEADDAETDSEATTGESNVDLDPLHNFIDFIVGGELGSSTKEDVQQQLNNVKTILKVFPNVAPFGSADGPELKDYEKKFQEAIDTHLKSAIANFKSLKSADGGEAAIEGLRTALGTFLANGLTILGKNVNGDEIQDLGSDEAISSDTETAEASDLSPEAIMAELGLDTSDDGKITTTTDEEKAMNALGWILNRLSTNKKYNTPKEISDFIYDQVKYKRGVLTGSKEFVKGVLRAIGARRFIPESKENDFDIEEFAQKFFSEIVKMSIDYRSSKDKKALRQASNELTEEVFNALKKYKKLKRPDPQDSSRIITNTDKTVTDMFGDILKNLGQMDFGTPILSTPEDIKYRKVLSYMEKNIKKMSIELFIKTIKKMNPNKITNATNERLKEISSDILELKPKKAKMLSHRDELEYFKVKEISRSETESSTWENPEFQFNILIGSGPTPLESFNIDRLEDGTPDTSSTTTEQLEFKLEKLVENYINKRKQQWRKRTM